MDHKTVAADSSRQKILSVAEKLFAEKGYHGTSTRDLARESGMNISLISYYFGNKEGLYKALFIEFAESAHEQLGRIIAESKGGKFTRTVYLKQMQMLIDGMIEMKVRRPYLHMMIVREMLSGLPVAKEVFEEVFEQLAERIITIIKSAQKEGIVRKDLNPYVLFMSLSQASDQFVTLSQCNFGLTRKMPKDFEIYKDQLFKIFIEGSLA